MKEPVVTFERIKRKPLSKVKINEISIGADPYDYISYDDSGPLLYIDPTDKSRDEIIGALNAESVDYIIMPPKGHLPRIEFMWGEYQVPEGMKRFLDVYRKISQSRQNLTPGIFIDSERRYTGPLEE